jgi:hypothetical protein
MAFAMMHLSRAVFVCRPEKRKIFQCENAEKIFTAIKVAHVRESGVYVVLTAIVWG